ncbi:hypothetical protein NDN08_006450 [Rhodosorus marinus]|uniref:Uncharacterized protein n=1 Tax=Rhodosorus marinus TaxID=101924 RepID=A0AAV8UL82_9RHOD|nr:hypothetical protein NDN08_006450 [Rhodosorus marinus]
MGILDWIYILNASKQKKKFFKDGLGQLEKLSDYAVDQPSDIDVNFGAKEVDSDGIGYEEGEFASPEASKLPTESKTAYVLRVTPPDGTSVRGIVVLMAAWGDKGYTFRRDQYAIPLAKQGYTSLLLMLPFYAKRRPSYQESYYLVSVHDLVLFFNANISEGSSLVCFARKQFPGTPVGVAGVSFGGGMATGSAIVAGGELALAEMMGGPGPNTMTVGGLRGTVDWAAMERDLGPKAQEKVHDLFVGYSLMGSVRERTDLYKTNEQLAAVGAAFLHDKIITPQLNEHMLTALQFLAGKSSVMYLPGSHVFGFTQGKTFVNLILRSFELAEELKKGQ